MSKMESDALSIISDGLAAVTEGCRLPVLCSTCTHHLGDNGKGGSHKTTCLFFASAFHTQVRMKNSEDWPKAEVISIRQVFPLVAPSLRNTRLLKSVIDLRI